MNDLIQEKDLCQIGKKRFDAMESILQKRRPELDAISTIKEIAKFKSTKEQKIAFFWLCNKSIILPEDAEKVKQAIKVASSAKIDPIQYKSPTILIEENKNFTINSVQIDPDTIPQLSDKKVLKNGIVTYEVENTRDGQKAIRNILNLQFGCPMCGNDAKDEIHNAAVARKEAAKEEKRRAREEFETARLNEWLQKREEHRKNREDAIESFRKGQKSFFFFSKSFLTDSFSSSSSLILAATLSSVISAASIFSFCACFKSSILSACDF